MTFGEYVRVRREALGISLREFCDKYGFDPSNTSKMERGTVSPPDGEDLVLKYGKALGLPERSEEMRQFLDMAAVERGRLPSDLAARPELLKTLPAFFKSLRVRKDPFEEDSKDGFLSHLRRERGVPYITTGANIVVNADNGRNFDYELTPITGAQPKIALEIFRLVQNEHQIASQRLHGQVWRVLKEELEKRGVKDYIINTPVHFTLRKADIREYCERVATAIHKTVDIDPPPEQFEVESFNGKRIEGLGQVVFSSRSGGAVASPEAIAEEALSYKLVEKDLQLPDRGYERILLAVNWSFMTTPDGVIGALANMDLSSLVNTDRIYLASAAGSFTLVYDRSIRARLEALEGPPMSEPALNALYHRWLAYRVGRNPSTIDLVRKVSGAVGGTHWIPDNSVREHIVWVAADRAKSGDIEFGLWAVDQFRHDPDPTLENHPDDSTGEFNLHARVRQGEQVLTISSVRAAVCWLVQKLVVYGDPVHFPRLFETIQGLVRDENFYVRQQATVPLIELAHRRWAKDADGRLAMQPELRNQIRDLALEMLRANAEFPRVLEWLGRVFQFLHDLTEVEAKLLIEILLASGGEDARQDVAHLLIYFALYRQDHFTELGRFDSAPFKALLMGAIQNGPNYLRATLAWQIARTLKEDVSHFTKLKDIVAAIPESACDGNTLLNYFSMLAVLPPDDQKQLASATEQARRKDKEQSKSFGYSLEETANRMVKLAE